MSAGSSKSQWLSLRCHPSSPCPAVHEIKVAARRLSDSLFSVSYELSGELDKIRIPPFADSERRDELWRHTCAEMFVAIPGQDAYYEFNFSPAAHWAAYEFSLYRQGMRPAECSAPTIQVNQSAVALVILVEVNVPKGLAVNAHWQVGLTMVIEDLHGQSSCWALSHADARPDFHRRESFIANF